MKVTRMTIGLAGMGSIYRVGSGLLGIASRLFGCGIARGRYGEKSTVVSESRR